jgi:Flp pilus assembly protein TadG
MRRLRDQRGAVGVTVALLMIPLVAFAAITIDVGAMWAERQQLQIGADAGALAVAQGCAINNCGTPAATAQTFATANLNAGTATATVTDPALTAATGSVTVRNSGVRQHWFAPVLGVKSASLTAQATVGWGAPTGGVSVLPLAFSWCEFKLQTGGGVPSSTVEHTILFTKSSQASCTGPSNNIVPGGFGWLTAQAGSCTAKSAIADILYSAPGNSVPSGCGTADFEAYQGKVVLLPIFNEAGDTGSNAWYRIYGYAAFTITGYDFGPGKYTWNGNKGGGSDRYIKGYFTKFVDLSDAFSYGAAAPQLGASIVSLTK